LWLIFKDHIKEYKNQMIDREKYFQESVNALRKEVEEWSEISHISLNTNKELLEIVKKHLGNGD